MVHRQSTLNQRSDDGVVVPTPEPETRNAAIRPDKENVLTIGLHRDDLIELGVPLGASGQDGDELHPVLSDGDPSERPAGGEDPKRCRYG